VGEGQRDDASLVRCVSSSGEPCDAPLPSRSRAEAVAAAASAREATHRTRRLAADAAERERRLLSELQACGARTLSLVAAQGALCVRLEAAAAAHRSAETSRSNVRAALSAAIAKLARLRERLGLGNATCASAQSSLLESSAAAADAQRRLCSARRSLAAAALRLQAVPQLEVEVATRQATLLEERQRAAAEMQARLAAPPLRRLQPPSRAELDRRTSALRAAVDAKQRELSALKADLLNSQEACEATRLRLAAAQASSRVSVAQQLNAQQAKLFATQRSVQALTAELRLYTAAIDRLAERRQLLAAGFAAADEEPQQVTGTDVTVASALFASALSEEEILSGLPEVAAAAQFEFDAALLESNAGDVG